MTNDEMKMKLAEAINYLNLGSITWTQNELQALAATEQADRYADNEWSAVIQEYVANDISWMTDSSGERHKISMPRSEPLIDVTIGEILENALDIPPAKSSQLEQRRVARCLVHMNYRPYQGRFSIVIG
jgi:putative DNA primase/helicase